MRVAILLGVLNARKVLLNDIKTLTFYEDQMTIGVRSQPVSQLDCVGGDACLLFNYLPKLVQCENVGWDGSEVKWKCSAELEDFVQFGETTVVCEGYESQSDPYVLDKSCGLEYSLFTTRKYREHLKASSHKWDFLGRYQKMKAKNPTPPKESFIWIVYYTWGFMALVLMLNCFSRRNSRSSDPDDLHSSCHEELTNLNQPKYKEYNIPRQTNGQGGGFWAGVFAGGAASHLISYLMGNHTTNRRDGNFGLGRSIPGYNRLPQQINNQGSSTRISTGYGGTRSRVDKESDGVGGTRRR